MKYSGYRVFFSKMEIIKNIVQPFVGIILNSDKRLNFFEFQQKYILDKSSPLACFLDTFLHEQKSIPPEA